MENGRQNRPFPVARLSDLAIGSRIGGCKASLDDWKGERSCFSRKMPISPPHLIRRTDEATTERVQCRSNVSETHRRPNTRPSRGKFSFTEWSIDFFMSLSAQSSVA